MKTIKCKAITKAKKNCANEAVLYGYCAKHFRIYGKNGRRHI
jgi:hypothetical protein